MERFDALRIFDAPDMPTFGEAARPWMRKFAEVLLGSYDPESGKRLIRDYFLLVSKKNGKSTLAAAIMLAALLDNWRQSAEFLIIAPSITAAMNSFKAARDMILADDDLRDVLKPIDNKKTILHRETGATLSVITADQSIVTGKKATGVLVDELWELAKKRDAESILAEATGGIAARPEGFVIYISTQSDSAPVGAFKQRLDYARKVRDGIVTDPTFLPVIYEFPEDMIRSEAYLEPGNWGVTNPNIGVSVDENYLSTALAKAQAGGKDSLRVFLSKHLNVEIGGRLLDDGWAGAQLWTRRVAPAVISPG